MPDKIKVAVYGKGEGCSKCSILKKRLAALLELPEYSGFEMEFNDVLTVAGMTEFLKAEVLNPSRIPGVLIKVGEGFVEQPVSAPECYAASSTAFRLGIQTDYSNGGVITPDNLKDVLNKAKEMLS